MRFIIKKVYPAIILVSLGIGVGITSPATARTTACEAPGPVCAARDGVFVISSYDPLASAVRIGPDLLVTNRHVTADQSLVKISLDTGNSISGRVVATGYQGDLVLIRAENLPAGPVLPWAKADKAMVLYTLGTDISQRVIHVSPPGKIILKPSQNAPFARLYHSALSRPGNSGGALVDEKGRLVGIVTSGGEGRYEAFPVEAIKKLKSLSGSTYIKKSQAIGTAIMACMNIQDSLSRSTRISRQTGKMLKEICAASNNRQLMDSAAVMLGRSRHFEMSSQLLEQALARDPSAINTRLSLVTTLIFSGRYADALPHIRKILRVIPEDGMLQRYAIQAGKFGGDMALANQGLALVEKYNPAQAEAAARFLRSQPPVNR